MNDSSYILLIMNCQKYRYKAEHQTKTWLPQVNAKIRYFHVIGDIELDKNYKFDNLNKILWVKAKDDYNSLPRKVIAAYEAILLTHNFGYIFKTDDDQMLEKPHFFDILDKIIQKKFPKSDYGGEIVDVKEPYLSQYYRIHPELPTHLPVLRTKYCSGRFYFISREAVIDLTKKKDKINNEFLEDYAMGYHLNEKFKTEILNIKTSLFFKDIDFEKN